MKLSIKKNSKQIHRQGERERERTWLDFGVVLMAKVNFGWMSITKENGRRLIYAQ